MSRFSVGCIVDVRGGVVCSSPSSLSARDTVDFIVSPLFGSRLLDSIGVWDSGDSDVFSVGSLIGLDSIVQ